MVVPYIAVSTLLVLHQIDAVYYREWEMFLLPGGYLSYMIFNLLAFPFVLFGFNQVSMRQKNAKRWSFFTAALGLITFSIHTLYFLFGDGRFELLGSKIIILLCLPASLWLGLAALRPQTVSR